MFDEDLNDTDMLFDQKSGQSWLPDQIRFGAIGLAILHWVHKSSEQRMSEEREINEVQQNWSGDIAWHLD